MAFMLNIDTLNEDMVIEACAEIQAYASELIPNADFSKGTALYDLLIRPAAILQVVAETNIGRARQAGSLLRIMQFPTLSDPDFVDELISNYRIYRKSGTIAGGTVQIKISSNVVTAVPSGAVFVSGGLRFFANQSFVGVPTEGLVSSTSDKLIQSIGNGVYAFQVEVTAEAAGSAYQIGQGTTLVMQTPPSNYISSSAAYDFSPGVGTETNLELIARMPGGLANRTPGNRINIESLVRDNYPDLVNLSTIGYGQPEMTRDQDNLFLFSYGGKSDLYAQTALRPQLVRVTKKAILGSAKGVWQMFFNRDEFAGAYQIRSILPPDRGDVTGTLKVLVEARSVDTTRPAGSLDMVMPHIDNYTQAAFSRYQTISVEFLDQYTSTAGLTPMVSTKDYYVDILVMPGIAQIQDQVLSDPMLTAYRYDDIIRAPIPVLVSASIGLNLREGDAPNITAMKQSIADRINQLGFRSSLSSSYIIDAVHNLLGPKSSVILPLDMTGELIDPSTGASKVYRSATVINIPTDYTKEISSNTVMFFCDPGNIDIYIARA